MTPDPQRIDVHHHFLPPEFIADLKRRNIAWTGGPPVPEWSVSIAREVMERNGIAAAVASVVPAVYWGDVAGAQRWARHCNEFLARSVQDDLAHFGGFATLPLLDTTLACRELEHALDVLSLDGVILWASQGVQYLGDPAFEELFQELERRSAIGIHPSKYGTSWQRGSEALTALCSRRIRLRHDALHRESTLQRNLRALPFHPVHHV